MTVIAFDGKTLACDSQISDNIGYWAGIKKIKRVDGWLIGAAGNVDVVSQFLTSFEPSRVDKILTISSTKDSLEGMAISPKGVVYICEEAGIYYKPKTKGYLAIGSGTKTAMAAMAAGATAKEATKITCTYDNSCGGRIYTLKL